MSTGPASLWVGAVPRALARDTDAFTHHLDCVTEATLTDATPLISSLVAHVHDNPDPMMTLELAFQLAGHDCFIGGYAKPSARALGWVVVAAARGDEEAAELLVLAHLIDLAGAVRRRPSLTVATDPEATHALWAAYRCAARTAVHDRVRRFFRSTVKGRIDRNALTELIHEIDDRIDDAAQLLPMEDLRQRRCTERQRDLDSRPRARILASIGDAGSGEGRRIARSYGDLKTPLPLVGRPGEAVSTRHILTDRFPWMHPVIDALHDDLRRQEIQGHPWVQMRPLLIEGPPGTGKSYIAQKLASFLEVPMRTLDVGGQRDNRALAGTARGWTSTQPSFPVQAIRETRVANPMLLVDEIDKAAASHNGDIHGTLLGLLDRKTAGAWPDECLMASCDLSHISWVLTCNDASVLPSALRSRVRHVRVEPPGRRHADAALAALAQDLRINMCWPTSRPLPIDEDAWAELRRGLAAGVDLRRVLAALERAVVCAPTHAEAMH